MATAPDIESRIAAAPAIGLAPVIHATPYAWREPATIPMREWVFGHWFLRGTIACVVAPGGVGKSTLMAGMALSLATGRPFLGKSVWEGPKRTWLWNLEDDLNELSRSIQAAALHHGISPAEVAETLFVDSGMEGATLCTAVEDGTGFRVLMPVYEALRAELIARRIDVLVVDPFVSSHSVSENDNGKIDAVAKAWARVAKDANCVIVLVHHTNKAGAGDVSALSARGAVALINAARCTLVLNRMADEDAERLGITKAERRRYLAVTDDKHNRAPAEGGSWFRLVSVDLGNGGMGGAVPGDNIAVAEPWKLPDPFDGLAAHHIAKVQEAIAGGEWRENAQSPAWAGRAVAHVLGLDPDEKAAKARIKSVLQAWIGNNVLKVVVRDDHKREPRKWIEVGERVEAAPPAQGWARHGAAG